jgi:Met-zincin/Domain of unknown function (DUF5117)
MPRLGSVRGAGALKAWACRGQGWRSVRRTSIGKFILKLLSSVSRLLLLLCLPIVVLGAEKKSPIDGFQSQPGLVDMHTDAATGRLIIGVHKLAQPMLLVSALPGALGSNDIGLDRAQQGEARLVEFRKLGERLFLVQLNSRFAANSRDDAEARSARDAFVEAVLWSGKLLNTDASKPPFLVEFGTLATSDQHGVAARLKATKQGDYTLDAERSAVLIESAKAFPDNIEIEALLTFTGDGDGAFVQQVATDAKTLSLRQQVSLIRLPAAGFQKRAFHPASGAFSAGVFDFAQPLDAPLDVKWQARFRLEKTDPTAARSTVVKPIVFYLDRGTPEPMRAALLEGANWWAAAFDAAGFIDAFRVELAPEGMDLSDIRNNSITWTHRATRGWSYGGGVIDPRSGEIIKGYVNLGSQRVRQDLLIAESLLAPYQVGADPILKQEAQAMALSRLRQLAAHEVGHALGFAHNFAANRNGNGSVLDYPHPLIQLVEGRVRLPVPYGVGVGDWDRFIVAHGYGVFSPEAEPGALAALRQEIAAKGYQYVSDADARALGDAHPEGVLWDIGSNPIAGFDHLLEVRAVALKYFADGALPPNRQLGDLERRLVPIYLLHRYQSEAVARLLGGAKYQYGLGAEAKSGAIKAGTEAVAATQQREALERLSQALDESILHIPQSILDQLTPPSSEYQRSVEYFDTHAGPLFDQAAATAAASAMIAQLVLAPERLNRLAWQHEANADVPAPSEIFARIVGDRWREKSSSLVVRTRNWTLLDALLNLTQEAKLHSTVAGDLHQFLVQLAVELSKRAKHNADAGRAAQLIAQYLESPATTERRPEPIIPPGAPI